MKTAQHLPSDHSPHVTAEEHVVGMPAGISQPQLVTKRWGQELIYINDPYCMKQIIINEGQKTSMHFHVLKHETLLVASGTLLLQYKDRNADEKEMLIPQGVAFVVPPGFQHQLCAYEGPVVIIEASTPDSPTDSVRVRM